MSTTFKIIAFNYSYTIVYLLQCLRILILYKISWIGLYITHFMKTIILYS